MDASVFKPETSFVSTKGTMRRAKGSKTSYARCIRPRLLDGGSVQSDRMGQGASPPEETSQTAVARNTTAEVLEDGLSSKLEIPASWARVTPREGPPEDARSQSASNLLQSPGDVPYSGVSPGTRKKGSWPGRRRKSTVPPGLRKNLARSPEPRSGGPQIQYG